MSRVLRPSVDSVILVLLAAVLVYTGIELRSTRATLLQVRTESRELGDSASVWRMESSVAHQVLYTIPLPPSIRAVDVADGVSLDVKFAGERVFYIVSPTCLACEENFPAMSELERQYPERVAVLTTASPDEAARAYSSQLGVMSVYSVLGADLGIIVSNAVTPITLMTRDQRRIRMWYGEVTEPVGRSLSTLLAGGT